MTTTELLLIVLDSDREGLDSCLAMTRETIASAASSQQVQDGIWTVEQAQCFLLADQLKSYIEDLIDDVSAYSGTKWGVLVTLIQCGFEDMDWKEAADHYLAKVGEGVRS